MDSRLHFNYDWCSLPKEKYAAVIREFLDNGANRFVITDPLLANMINDHEMITFIKNLCNEMHVYFSMVHGLFGGKYDLNFPDPEQRKASWKDHRRCMETAAEFGCRTYVVHVGAHAHCTMKMPLDTLRPLAIESVEKLLPTAEKCGIILAVENSFEPPNSAREVMSIIKPFIGNPHIGVCYDTGHANCMMSAPGKDKALYHPSVADSWLETGVIWEDDALDILHDHIVSCHIHDNNGYADQHGMPFDGTTNWQELMPRLFALPRIADFYAEVCMKCGSNWAGRLLAPAGGYSIRRMTDSFRYLGF